MELSDRDIEKGYRLLEAASQYFSILLKRFPEYGVWLWKDRQVLRSFGIAELYRSLMDDLKDLPDKEGLKPFVGRVFRRFKQKHFLRLAFRDVTGLDRLSDTTAQLSDMATVLLQAGLRLWWENPDLWLSSSEASLWKSIRDGVRISILGLGKLGGHELNFVSDIDLLFIYEASSKEIGIRAQEYLPRLCQSLTRLFSDLIDGDRVFIVDLRLRPGGKDGEVVSPLAYALHHYLVEGKSWERLALIKANPVAGDISLGNQFLQEVQPFVFRRFLDFQAIDEIISMRNRILKETPLEPPGPGFDVKLGKGGIREIEFLAASFQLIYGGRYTGLREKNTLKCLESLRREKFLECSEVDHLEESYMFLRRVEHWIQLGENRQSQQIPGDPLNLDRLLKGLGLSDVDAFVEELTFKSQIVHDYFLRLFSHEAENPDSGLPPPSRGISPPGWAENLLGEELAEKIWRIADESFLGLGGNKEREDATNRLRRFFQALSRRPGLVRFLEMLSVKNIEGLKRCLVSIIHLPLSADLLIQMPGLSEGFIDPFKRAFHPQGWLARSRDILESANTFEEKLYWLRRIKNETCLKIALWHFTENPDISDVEEELTALADFFVEYTYKMLCHSMNISFEEYSLVIATMGKFGSREMGYHSDLDLVFIYGDPDVAIPEETTRFIQRYVRLLSMPLEDGSGYKIDMRLRPTGNYGPLIVTTSAWKEYYEKSADLWEIVSLLRFRTVAGRSDLRRFLEDQAKVFCGKRYDSEEVWYRLCELKVRMERERTDEAEEALHLKLGKGGTVEMELLCHGSIAAGLIREGTSVLHPVRTMKVLPLSLQALGLSDQEIREVIRAYRVIKHLMYRLDLLNKSSEEFVPRDFDTLFNLGLWGKDSEFEDIQDFGDIKRLRRTIRRVWNRLCEARG